jgi:hypothetical protein
MNRLALFLLLLVIAAVGGLLLIGLSYPVKDLATETYKSLLQLVVVAVAGHVVSILITKANNERQDLLRADELRNDLLSRLNKCYVDVKKVRRVIRATAHKVAEAETQQLYIDKTRFHDFLQAINETQLELELLSKDVESNKRLFIDAKALTDRLDSMEEYLNTIIDEYEHSSVKVVKKPANCYFLEEFEKLSDLVGEYRTSDFRTEFVHKYYASLESIRNAFVIRS